MTVYPTPISFYHSAHCRSLQNKREIDRAAWKARWPNSCPLCAGNPISTTSGPGYLDPPEVDLCPCYEFDCKCPRCGTVNGEAWMESDERACPVCGWNWGKGSDDVCPYPWEDCSCQHDDEIYSLLQRTAKARAEAIATGDPQVVWDRAIGESLTAVVKYMTSSDTGFPTEPRVIVRYLDLAAIDRALRILSQGLTPEYRVVEETPAKGRIISTAPWRVELVDLNYPDEFGEIISPSALEPKGDA